MQSKEMKLQNMTANNKRLISDEGLKKMAKEEKEGRLKMMEKSKTDIIGFLYELPEYLSPESKQESSKEIQVFENLINYLQNEKYSFDTQDTILCLANEYGMAAEESGFRNGFAVAMRICMESLTAVK